MAPTRRALLLAALPLGIAAVDAVTGATSSEVAPLRSLVWRDGVAAHWQPGSAPVPLPAALAAAPEVTDAGVWVVTPDARLQRWRFDAGWQQVADAALPEPAHALTASADGQAAMAACGEELWLFDARGTPLRRHDGVDRSGRRRGRVSVLRSLPHRRSLLAAWPALHEWWELSVDPAAPPIFDGLVHDHRMGEAIARPGYLGARRVPFEGPAPRPAFAPPALPWVAADAGPDGVPVVHLDVRRTVAQIAAPGADVGASALHDGLWWLPTADGLWGLDPRRWIRRAALPAPAGRVRALVSAGGSLWALVGAALLRRTPDGWVTQADGVGALAGGAGPRPLWADEPWQGVAALP
jgi:hypothetical protein